MTIEKMLNGAAMPGIVRDLPGGGFLMIRKTNCGRFLLTATCNGKTSEDTYTAQEAVEAMSCVVSVFLKADLAGAPGAKEIGEESMGFMQEAVNKFPELGALYSLMAGESTITSGVCQ